MAKVSPNKEALPVLVKQKLYFAAALLRQYQQLNDPLPGDQEALLQAVVWHLMKAVDAFSHELAVEYQLELPVKHWSFAALDTALLQQAPGLLALQQLLHQSDSWLSGLNGYYCRVTALHPNSITQLNQQSAEVQTFIATSESSPFQALSLYYQSLETFIQHWREQLVEY